MKILNWLSAVLFMGCCILFIGYGWTQKLNRDNVGPVIQMEENRIEVSVHDGKDALLRGISAIDQKDGDVTSSLVVESVSDFTEEGVRYVNYAAFDQNDNVTKASREMVYTDYTPIRFSMESPMRFSMSSSTQNLLEGISVQDCIDGDLTDQITFSQNSTVDLSIVGDYPIELQIVNTVGDVAKLPLTVTVYDAAKERMTPQICLSEYLVYTKIGNAIDPLSYLESVDYNGISYEFTTEQGTFRVDPSEMSAEERTLFQEEQSTHPSVSYSWVKVRDNVDYSVPGVYEIRYSLEDDQANQGNVNLVVVVEG